MNRVLYIGLLFCLGVVAGSVGAIDLAEQPVHTAMQQQVRQPLALGSDEFDDMTVQTESEQTVTQPGRKSLKKALLYSFVLPGMGEYYAGSRKKARYFWAAEAAFWTGFVGFRMSANSKEDDYLRIAEQKAGIDLSGESEFTRKMVGFYTSTDEYNGAGRVSDPERPYYDPNGQYAWQWTSNTARDEYRELRNDSDELKRRSNFMVLGMILNRVVSMVDAAIDVKRVNSDFSDSGKTTWGWDVSSDPLRGDENIHVSVFARF